MKTTDHTKLSIITINLNNKDGLRSTIESVVNQTSEDFEYIVIDGASTDGSVDVMNKYQDKIQYWISEKDTGIYNAMNKGIKIAKGEYFLFLNSGDCLINNTVLESALKLIEHDAAVCSADIYFEETAKRKHYSSPISVDFNYLYYGSLSHPSTFIQKRMFEKYGLYNELNRIASDWEFFFLVLIIKAEKYQKLPATLTVFNLAGISNEKSMESIIQKERKDAIGRHIPKPILTELASLQNELSEYKILKQRVSGRRYELLQQIEKNTLLSRFTTIFLLAISKFAKIFTKS